MIAKFWAYARSSITGSTAASSATSPTYPIFNKYGAVNLGEVAGGVRLFWAELVAGVINWSLAAPLFSDQLRAALARCCDRSLRPLARLVQREGRRRAWSSRRVRVMRWGLWMSPIINSFLRQSPDPTWYNQDGAVRTVVAIGADIATPSRGLPQFSLMIFPACSPMTGCAILIWFDHMGLRVATLVNLSFLGGDRADEAAGRFVGHGARTRAIPDGIRRFGTWAPLLIPFYIPRGRGLGQGLDRRGDARARRRRCRVPVRTLAFAYAVAGAGIVAAALAIVSGAAREARGGRPLARGRARRARASAGAAVAFNNGAVGVEIWRDGRGAAIVHGRRARRRPDRSLPPPDRSAAGARPVSSI